MSVTDERRVARHLTGPPAAVPAVNAVPAVCAAAPGIRTYADLPVVTSRMT